MIGTFRSEMMVFQVHSSSFHVDRSRRGILTWQFVALGSWASSNPWVRRYNCNNSVQLSGCGSEHRMILFSLCTYSIIPKPQYLLISTVVVMVLRRRDVGKPLKLGPAWL